MSRRFEESSKKPLTWTGRPLELMTDPHGALHKLAVETGDYEALLAIARGAIVGAFQVLYVYTPEYYATELRGLFRTACRV